MWIHLDLPRTSRFGPYSYFSFQIGVEGVWDLCLCLFSGHGEFSPNPQACYSNPHIVRLFFWTEVRGKSHTRSLPFLQYLLLLSSASWSYPFESVKKSVPMTESLRLATLKCTVHLESPFLAFTVR